MRITKIKDAKRTKKIAIEHRLNKRHDFFQLCGSFSSVYQGTNEVSNDKKEREKEKTPNGDNQS
jgi:hypothetical protein